MNLRDSLRDRLPGRSNLEAGVVHLWWGQVGAVESLDSVRAPLSDEEHRRSERFRRERDARAFLFRRAFRRRVLAAHLGVEASELCFTSAEFGKPALLWPTSDVSFNASSSGAWILVAVADGRALGVDVERRDERLADPEELSRLARRVLTASEHAALLAHAPAARLDAFLRLWTRKEAVLKLLGTGLSREPDTLEVGLAPAARARTLVVHGTPAVPALLTLDLPAPSDHCASVVAQGLTGERLDFRVHGADELMPRAG